MTRIWNINPDDPDDPIWDIARRISETVPRSPVRVPDHPNFERTPDCQMMSNVCDDCTPTRQLVLPPIPRDVLYAPPPSPGKMRGFTVTPYVPKRRFPIVS